MDELNSFLKVASQFHLGDLPTEMPHPKTTGLSSMSIEQGIKAFLEVERDALSKACATADIQDLFRFTKAALDRPGRLFFVGCGATGRLSLSLESFFRRFGKFEDKNKIISFMAGGDVAFIRSIEQFEDFEDYGKRQLLDLGFKKGDSLVAITEGGETPFVLGAALAAVELSPDQVAVAHCNPTDLLTEKLERCRKTLLHANIKNFSFPIGPMALSGSTRLQATTVLEYVVGGALFFETFEKLNTSLSEFQNMLADLSDQSDIKSLIEWELDCLKNQRLVTYRVPAGLSAHLLTDTTERSPTFCLTPFAASSSSDDPSAVYIVVAGTENPHSAWLNVLGREPRVVEWEETKEKTGRERLLDYNLSEDFLKEREKKGAQVILDWSLGPCLEAQSGSFSVRFPLPPNDFEAQMLIKVILNCHSTLMMGKFDRFESNIMTWVRPSNNKLIDRTIRYVQYLLKEKGIDPSYEEIARKCFEIKKDLHYEESIVLKTVAAFKSL